MPRRTVTRRAEIRARGRWRIGLRGGWCGCTRPPPDAVNHPPHYNAHPSGVECITVVEHMGFNVGNAIKYLWRADEKGAPIEDLRKAAWYVQREIERR
jgi:hypothetical protein